MQGLSGMDLAVELRERDETADLIFLTSSPEFALESYSVRAPDYLLKPVDREKLFSALDRAIARRREQARDELVLRSGGRLVSVPLGSIEYVEARQEKLVFRLNSGETLESAAALSVVCLLAQWTLASIWGFEAGNKAYPFIVHLPLFLLCALSSVEGKQNERFLSLKQCQELLSLQSAETEKRMEEIRYSWQKTRAIRRDMRHYLQIIDGYAAAGDTASIREYVRQVQTGIDETMVTQYCPNEQVNLVVSSCLGKAKKQDVEAAVSADVPENLEERRTLDLCILLANALENAAVAAAKTAKPWAELNCGMVGEKLVVQVTNSCCEGVAFENGIPQSGRTEHGFGTYSIATLAEKHGGTADFSCRDGVFTKRAVM